MGDGRWEMGEVSGRNEEGRSEVETYSVNGTSFVCDEATV